MMNKIVTAVLLLCCMVNTASAQLKHKLDSLLGKPSGDPFNGVVLVTEGRKVTYHKTFGFGDSTRKTKIRYYDRFVIGSVSKQFTAVMVLQQYEKGKLKLNDTITKYLTYLPKDWNPITIHQLLTHTHGIVNFEKPLAFKPGTRFMYSQHGFELLAQILEKITGLSFAEQSRVLLKKCMMKNTSHPSYLKKYEIVTCFTKQADGTLKVETNSLVGFVAAGGFVSTASDLAQWNKCLFGGKLLRDSTLKLMTTPKEGAIRDHPIFGKTLYGYGITIDSSPGFEQYGQTGFADGFASMNFYFPATKTSVVVLENVIYHPDNLKETFYYHTSILEIARNVLRRSGR